MLLLHFSCPSVQRLQTNTCNSGSFSASSLAWSGRRVAWPAWQAWGRSRTASPWFSLPSSGRQRTNCRLRTVRMRPTFAGWREVSLPGREHLTSLPQQTLSTRLSTASSWGSVWRCWAGARSGSLGGLWCWQPWQLVWLYFCSHCIEFTFFLSAKWLPSTYYLIEAIKR